MVPTKTCMDPEESTSIGLARIVVTTDSLMEEAKEVAQRLGDLSRTALSLARRAILEGSDMSLAAELGLER